MKRKKIKKVILMRHAEPDRANLRLSNIQLPLNKRGEEAAASVGKLLREMELIPDLIISSSAVRAFSTAEIFAKSNGYEREILKDENLYYGSKDDYLEIIQATNKEIDTIMLIAHNSTISFLASALSNEGLSFYFETASVVVFSASIKNWRKLMDNSCKLVYSSI